MTNQTWSLDWTVEAKKQLFKLDRPIQKRVLSFLYQRVLTINNPRLFGKPLKGKLAGYWSYRVGEYRIIAQIKDDQLVILVVQLDHRRDVYDLF